MMIHKIRTTVDGKMDRRSFLAGVGAAIVASFFPRWTAAKELVRGVGRGSWMAFDNLQTEISPSDFNCPCSMEVRRPDIEVAYMEIVNDDGEVWYTRDGGATWTQ